MPSAGSASDKVEQRVLRLVHLVEMGLHRIVHHLFDRMGLERAGGDDDQRQRVADQGDQRLVGEQRREFGEDRGIFRILHMRFQRDRAFGAQQAHQLGRQQDRIDVILLGVLGPLNTFCQAGAELLELVRANCPPPSRRRRRRR